MRSNELAEVAQALVHRLGHAGDVPSKLDKVRTTMQESLLWLRTSTLLADEEGGGRSELLLEFRQQLASYQEQVTRHLDHVEKRFSQIDDLLPALRNVAKLKEMDLRPLDLRTVIDRALERLDRTDSLHIDRIFPPEAILTEGDAALLQEAFFLLLENACDAMRDGGRLKVTVQSAQDGRAIVDIVDTGHGIDASIQQRIFEPGFTTRQSAGQRVPRGQGLFVCRAVLRRHRGDVELARSSAEGSTFTCHLPLLRPDH